MTSSSGARRRTSRAQLGAANGFKAERNKLLLLPGSHGRPVAVVAGLGKRNPREDLSCWAAAAIAGSPARRPLSSRRSLAGAPGDSVRDRLGVRTISVRTLSARAVRSERCNCDCLPKPMRPRSERLRAATALARDLVNTPANDMSPEALAQAAVEVARRYGARHRVIIGDDLLKERFPAVHAVGRAAAVAPRLVDIEWGEPSHPKVTLVGKGVCFDTGGLDIKPGASMLLMKKDMGGAAVALALAQLDHGCEAAGAAARAAAVVENAISANAYPARATCSARAKD